MNRSLYLHTQENNWIFFSSGMKLYSVIAICLGGNNWTYYVGCKWVANIQSVHLSVYTYLCRKQLLVSIFAVCYVSFCDIDHAQTVVSQFSSVSKIRHTNEYNVYVCCIVSRTTGFWLDIFRYFHFLLPSYFLCRFCLIFSICDWAKAIGVINVYIYYCFNFGCLFFNWRFYLSLVFALNCQQRTIFHKNQIVSLKMWQQCLG